MTKENLFKKILAEIRDLSADEPDADRQKKATIKREVKHIRRVTKRGEKSLAHGSEAFETHVLSEKDIEITREVIQGVFHESSNAPTHTAIAETPSFKCFGCGARIPKDPVRCPECGVKYVNDPLGEAVDENLEDTAMAPSELLARGILKEGSISFAHFDVSSGIVTYLQSDEEETDYGLECHGCGAVTQFGTDRCPLCGRSFDEDDTGLVGILAGLKFDLDCDNELDCPSCGEHVVADGGRCPSCKEIINLRSSHIQDAGVLTVLNERNIVFVHLDVWNGDLWFARKMEWRKTGDTESVHLESISRVGFEHDWQSLARM
jgi:RNA polymerase subunit RPABC4/transcription elongation factor Spt4